MTEITALFWDIGGVILTNGWDRTSRQAAAERFHLDWEEFEDRHDRANPPFEMGQLSLDEYLHRTVFYRTRSFASGDFKSFILGQSAELAESRAVLDALTNSGRYFVAAINNEGRELNEHRIKHFDLRRNFSAFFSSCYLNLRKPDEAIYRLALNVTQRAAEECVFIDDRPINLEYAARLGMRAIQFQNASQLNQELTQCGVVSHARQKLAK